MKVAVLYEQNNQGFLLCWSISGSLRPLEYLYPAGITVPAAARRSPATGRFDWLANDSLALLRHRRLRHRLSQSPGRIGRRRRPGPAGGGPPDDPTGLRAAGTQERPFLCSPQPLRIVTLRLDPENSPC